jgi:hypothetical protein
MERQETRVHPSHGLAGVVLAVLGFLALCALGN